MALCSDLGKEVGKALHESRGLGRYTAPFASIAADRRPGVTDAGRKALSANRPMASSADSVVA